MKCIHILYIGTFASLLFLGKEKTLLVINKAYIDNKNIFFDIKMRTKYNNSHCHNVKQ